MKRWLLLLMIGLLGFTGGFMDGYTLLLRDGVFSTMQTGNLIFLVICIVSNQLDIIYIRLLPIIFFILGTIIVTILRISLKRDNRICKIISIIAIITSIIVASLIDIGEYNFIVTSILSLAASFQFAAFSDIDSIPLTTTMCTANMRYASENIVELAAKKERKYLYNFLKYLLVIISFSLGVIVSYFGKNTFSSYEILLTLPAYLCILVMYFMQKRNNLHSFENNKEI